MKWFEGNIPSAINQAKQKHAIFVVYISGQDDISKQMDTTWDDEAVSCTSEESEVVALRLDANSESCGQFSSIYPVVCVPCTFFIGENGVPLEVTGGYVEPKAFIEKIQQVVQMHNSQKSGQTVAPLTKNSQQESTSPAQSPGATTAAMETTSSQSDGSNQVSNEAETSATVPEVKAAAEEASTSQSLDDKLSRANELLKVKREEKSRKEVEDLKQKEKERRELGKGLNKLQHFKEEQSRKEMVNEWKKEKEEKIKERERVREQLARDREEKNARFRAEREAREKLAQEAKRVKLEEQTQASAQQEARKMERARLQFRLPDGSSVTNQFSSSDTLQTARDFLHERIGDSFGRFSLSMHYPKRDFTDADNGRTLLELELAPSAILIVLPGSRSSSFGPVSAGGNSSVQQSGSILMWILGPFLALWNFLCGLLFGGSSSSSSSQGGSTSQSSSSSSARSSQPMDSSPSTSQGARPRTGYGLRSRQEGNITRLSALRDDDDDRTTWNGNSTQQM